MNLEALLAEVNARGLRVNNLFQRRDWTWQANVTDGAKFHEFGLGATAAEALGRALDKAPASVAAPAPSEDDLLKELLS